jgi:hypothetical protein
MPITTDQVNKATVAAKARVHWNVQYNRKKKMINTNGKTKGNENAQVH